MWSVYGGRPPREVVVRSVDRLADLVAPLQNEVAKARSRQAMLKAAEDLIDVIDALDMYGREARRVTFDGGAPHDMKSSREFEWRGQRP
jgi:hypothetical protein